MADILNQQENVRIQEEKTRKSDWAQWLHVYRWGVLIVAVLFLVALVTYLLNGNLTWRPHGQWHWAKETKDKNGTELPPVTSAP